MKMKHVISLVFPLALAGLIGVSCTKVSGDDPAPPNPTPDETGYFSFSISVDNALNTRADGTDPDISLSSMRIIFYNSAGVAVLVEDYWIYDDYYSDDYLEITPTDYRPGNYFGEDNRVPIPPTDGATEIVIRRNPLELPVQDYQIAVLFNYGGFYTYSENDGSNTGLYENTANTGHLKNILFTPINIHRYSLSWYGEEYADDYESYEKLMSAYPMFFENYYSKTTLAGLNDDNYLFMGNADGLFSVSREQLAGTTADKPFKPTDPIRVDRAVAKVVLYKGDDLTGDGSGGFVYEGHTVKDVTWVPDILNFQINPLRVPDKVAPNSPSFDDSNGNETPSTPREYRYAKDPNWTDYSRLRNPSSSDDLEKQFMYITSDTITMRSGPYEQEEDLFEKTWSLNKPAIADEKLWYYIPENTMAANEQWEDVTTRVLIRCNYIPPTAMTIGEIPIAAKASYYAFQGKVIPVAEFLTFLSNPETLPEELNGLYDIVTDQNVKNELMTGNNEPSASLTVNGVSFYKGGVNFYAIPIRHFDDAKSGGPMGYGRYGVVRNNVYNITIDGFYGPGSPLIPKPEGPNDKESNINATIKVVDWKLQYLNFEF